MTVKKIILINAAVVVAVLVAAAAGWAGYWHYIAARVPEGLAAWAQEQRVQGFVVRYGAVEVGGFPTRLEIRVGAPVLARLGGPTPWTWRAEAVQGEIDLFGLREVAYRVAGGGELEYRTPEFDGAFHATAAEATGRLRLDRAGVPEFGIMAVLGLQVRLPNGEGVFRAGRVRIESRHRPATAEASRDGSVEIEWLLENLVLPEKYAGPLGPRIARFAAEVRVEGTSADLAALDGMRAMVAAWRDGNGRVALRALELDWGPVRLTARGTVTLDRMMRPAGELETFITGYGAILDALVAAGEIRRRNARAARLVLDLLARTPAGGGPKVLKVQIGARDGFLSLGPFSLIKLPAIVFPD